MPPVPPRHTRTREQLTISVAVATVDRPEALRRCLAAIMDGSLAPAELIVVDQGGLEETRRAVEEQRGTGVPARHVVVPARGLSAARNAAVSAAAAPFVAVTDDDCVPDRRWLEAVVRTLATSLVDAVTGPVLPLGPPAPGRHAVSSRTSRAARTFAGRRPPWQVGTGANFATSVGWLGRVGGYDERLGAGTPGRAGEDLDLVYRLLRAGARIRYEPQALVFHERATTERRRATRSAYGTGVGAVCALTLRRGDGYGAAMLARWLLLRARLLLAAAARRCGVDEELLVLAGTLRGLAYGGRLRPRSR